MRLIKRRTGVFKETFVFLFNLMRKDRDNEISKGFYVGRSNGVLSD